MMQTLKKGMTNKDVAIIKYVTNYSKIGEATETFDAAFETFIKKLQTSYGLNSDGIIGEKTYKEICIHFPVCSTSKNKTSSYTCGIQMLVGADADGIYGSKTKMAVAAYQASVGLDQDGKAGPKTISFLILGIEKHSDNVKPVDNKQYDPKWKSKPYSIHRPPDQTIGSSGCGPSAASDIVATWWDKTVTPVEMCEFSLKKGCRTDNSGTATKFMAYVAEKYKASKYVGGVANMETMINCLDTGGYVVVRFGPGKTQKWTKGGHYCVIYKYDGTYFYINDPASASSTRAKGTYAEVKDARKDFFLFWK